MSQVLHDVLSRGAASVFGLFLAISATISLLRTIVIPRALRSAISDTVAGIVIGVATILSRLRRSYARRDGVLAWVGPSIILLQLITWLLLYLIAYGFLIYGVSGNDLGESMRQAGSSLFTLGFASADQENETIIDFVAAATGPIVIALLIGFLPTIYSTYLDREQDVTALSAMAGEPAWGPELLSRLSLTNDLDASERLFHDWSGWAARLRMTHVTYPVLVWVRSVRSSRHYAIALLAVLDAAALRITLNRSIDRTSAYNVLIHGGQAMDVLYGLVFRPNGWRGSLPLVGQLLGARQLVRNEARAMPGWTRGVLAVEMAADLDAAQGLAGSGLATTRDADTAISREEFDRAVAMLAASGFPIDADLDLAWQQFAIARSRYEAVAYALCSRLDATPAPWSGSRRVETPVEWPTLASDLVPRAEPPAPPADTP